MFDVQAFCRTKKSPFLNHPFAFKVIPGSASAGLGLKNPCQKRHSRHCRECVALSFGWVAMLCSGAS